MERGWNAKGRLRPLWERLPGKRDELAARSGILGPTLSGYNTGRLSLGEKNARKIAAVLDISLAELGAPADLGNARDGDLARLLEGLRETVDSHQRTIESQRRAMRALQSRVRALEQAQASGEPATVGQKPG